MKPRSLREIADIVAGTIVGEPERAPTGICLDSRHAARDDLFVALAGSASDGHDYVDGLQGRVAAALVAREVAGSVPPQIVVDDVERALADLARHERTHFDGPVVAITGSVGKTTVKDLCGAIAQLHGPAVVAQKSHNNHQGVPLTLLGITTETSVVICELGTSGAGELTHLASIAQPTHAVVTAVRGAHLEQLGSLDGVQAAKRELVEALDTDGIAILNADDPRVAAMASAAPGRVVFYGTGDHGGPVALTSSSLDKLGRAQITAKLGGQAVEVTSQAAGAHHVSNLLAALTVAAELELDPQAAANALTASPAPPGRGRVVEVGFGDGQVVVLDDSYNANKASMCASLDALASIGASRRIAVLGGMLELGPTGEDEHAEVGAHLAERGIDVLIAVRGIDAVDRYLDAPRAAGAAVHAVGRPEDALVILRDILRPGDAVSFKSSLFQSKPEYSLYGVPDAFLTWLASAAPASDGADGAVAPTGATT